MWIPIHRGQKAKRGSAIACSCCALKLDQLILLVTTCWTNEGICHRLLRTCCFRSDGAALLLILGLFLSIGPLSCLKKKKSKSKKSKSFPFTAVGTPVWASILTREWSQCWMLPVRLFTPLMCTNRSALLSWAEMQTWHSLHSPFLYYYYYYYYIERTIVIGKVTGVNYANRAQISTWRKQQEVTEHSLFPGLLWPISDLPTFFFSF